MTPLGSYYNVPAGLGGVRALAGLGCATGCGCQAPAQSGLGGVLDFVKSPLGVGLLLLIGAVGYAFIRESGR